MRRSTKRWLLVLLLAGCGVTAGKAVYNLIFDDFKGRGEHQSVSSDVARARGIFVEELAAEPNEIEVPGGRIRFEQAWVEERSAYTWRYVWFLGERRIGGYRLSFTLTDRKVVDASDLMFVQGDAAHSVRRDSMGGVHVYNLEIESPDVTGVRLSVVQTFQEPRAKNVRFVPKEGGAGR